MNTTTPEAPAATEPVVDLDLSLDTDEGGNSFLDTLNKLFEEPGEVAPEPKVLPGAEDPEPGAEKPETSTEKPDSEKTADDFLLEDDEITADWTAKSAARYKRLKAELKETRAARENLTQKTLELENRVKELTGTLESKDYETLQKKVEEYEHQQRLTNLENTAAYREAVGEPLQRLVKQSDEIAARYDVDPEALLDVLAMDDEAAQEEQLAELLVSASDRDKARVYRIIEEINPILERRAELQKNAQEALREAQLVEEERARIEAADNAKKREQMTSVVVERVREKVPFLNELGVDADRLKKEVSSVDFDTLHLTDQAYNVAAGKMFPTIVREYASILKERDALIERLAAYDAADPGAGHSDPGARTLVDDEIGFGESLERALRGR
jgi:chromosome segregation ATPase